MAERLQVIAVGSRGVGEFNRHVGALERLAVEVLLVVHIDDAYYLMATPTGNLLNHPAHFPIAYQCYFHVCLYYVLSCLMLFLICKYTLFASYIAEIQLKFA